eukprot:gene573-8083_t
MLLVDNSSKDEFLRQSLKDRESEFSELKNFKVAVCTFNVNEKVPGKNDSVVPWMHLEQEPDIICAGLQEVDMSAEAMVKIKTEASDDWAAYLDSQLESNGLKYKRITCTQLVGLCLIVYVKKEHAGHVKHQRGSAVGCGALGSMGNKGGVALRFKFYESTFLFITAHLYPHMKGVEKRNKNFHTIMKSLDFGEINKKFVETDKHDYIFFCGDLNYRVGTLEDAEVKKGIKDGKLEYLFKYDQLSIEKDAGRVLWGFEEAFIKFAPTYKFDPGTTIYDSSEKKRTPGWTDRVLWKGQLKEKINVLDYDCHTILISDHRPVSLFCEAEVKKFVDYRLKETKEAILAIYAEKHKTRQEEIGASNILSLERNTDQFIFENIRYGVDEEQILILTNNLSQKVEFEFIGRSDEKQEPCEPWMKIHPKKGMVSPGISKNIKLTIKIDLKTWDFDSLAFNLKDVFKLHLTNGKINKSKVDFLKSNLGSKLKIPKELFRLVDFIWKYGIRNPSLFQEQGEEDEENFIREAIDSGTPLSGYTGSINSVSECLLKFLESLSESVIPSKYFTLVLEKSYSSQLSIELINDLPPLHFNTFVYIITFLRQVLENKDANLLSIDILAIGFSNVLIRSPTGRTQYEKEDEKLKTDHHGLLKKHN